MIGPHKRDAEIREYTHRIERLEMEYRSALYRLGKHRKEMIREKIKDLLGLEPGVWFRTLEGEVTRVVREVVSEDCILVSKIKKDGTPSERTSHYFLRRPTEIVLIRSPDGSDAVNLRLHVAASRRAATPTAQAEG